MSHAPRSLSDWLEHAERQHVVGVDLGLERITRVARSLGFEAPGHRPAPRNVIVAGTNGKGSTCVALEALLRQSGLRVGATLSPHLHVFNERVRIDGEPISDQSLCQGFEAVERARGEVPLTYFEYGTLVAMVCFRTAAVDVAILEVGLGGRLDAMNLVDADVAIVTSIGLDHQAYLGDDLESIGREKAGVMRPGQRVILGREVSRSVVDTAHRLGCHVTRLGADIHVTGNHSSWAFSGTSLVAGDLPSGSLAPDNCALALEAAAWLTDLNAEVARRALSGLELPGRFEHWRLGGPAGGRWVVLDVAHNPAAARFLARRLAANHPGRRFTAILGSLADKDLAGVATELDPLAGRWICVPTFGPRGRTAADCRAALGDTRSAATAQTLQDALAQALDGADTAPSRTSPGEGDGILVLGAFSVIERARLALQDGFAGAVRQCSGPSGDDGR